MIRRQWSDDGDKPQDFIAATLERGAPFRRQVRVEKRMVLEALGRRSVGERGPRRAMPRFPRKMSEA